MVKKCCYLQEAYNNISKHMEQNVYNEFEAQLLLRRMQSLGKYAVIRDQDTTTMWISIIII